MSQLGRLNAVSFETALRNTQTIINFSQNVSQNLLLKVDPLSTIGNSKLIKQGGRLETSAKLRVFVSNISSPS